MSAMPTFATPAKPRPRVAFVVQRCGEEVNGGAEMLCRDVAIRMARHWSVEVLTTCALHYDTWANHYPEGVSELQGVTVRRFANASQRDMAHFDRLSREVIAAGPGATPEMQAEWMRAQGPWCPALYDFIAANQADYDAFFFFGYLYAQTFFALPLVASKAILVPFAHDEWAIHFPMWDDLFRSAAGMVYSTPEEQRFLNRRFPGLDTSWPVIGTGIERPGQVDAAAFRKAFSLNDSFLLYAGRVDPSKGCGDLMAIFMAMRQGNRGPKKLVLIGRPMMPIPQHPDIIVLGYVDDQVKWNAYAAADIVVMPSPYESLSITLLEGWALARPALVNGKCSVLVDQCRRSQGGLWYDTPREFMMLSEALLGKTGAVLGQQGREFVDETYAWDVIEKAYQGVFNRLAA